MAVNVKSLLLLVFLFCFCDRLSSQSISAKRPVPGVGFIIEASGESQMSCATDLSSRCRVEGLTIGAKYRVSSQLGRGDFNISPNEQLIQIREAQVETITFRASPGRPEPYVNDIRFIDNFPEERGIVWGEDLQGIAHDSDYWFLSQAEALWKIPVTHRLATDPTGVRGFRSVGIPEELRHRGLRPLRRHRPLQRLDLHSR